MFKKPRVFNFVLIAVSLVVLVFYVLLDGFNEMISVFFSCRFGWILCGVFAMFSYWFLEASILNRWLDVFGKKLSFRKSMKNCVVGQFFNNITPSATGGQPFQIYYLKKCGIDYGIAVSSLFVKFLCFQISLTLICVLVVIFKFRDFFYQDRLFSIFMIVGFLINSLVAVVLMLIGFNKNLSLKILKFLIKFLGKLRIVKDVEQKLKFAEDEVTLFNNCFLEAFNHGKTILVMMLLSVLQLILFYSVSVIIALAFGINLNFSSVFKILSGAACVQMGSTFIPLPGAIGGAEFSYHAIYGGIFEAEKLSIAILLWRIYTFYLPVIVGLFFSKDVFSKEEEIDE